MVLNLVHFLHKIWDSKLIYQQNLNTSKLLRKMLSLFIKNILIPIFERTFNLINNTLKKNDITPICEVYSSFIEELKIIGFPICRTVFASELILDTKNNNLIYGVEMVNFLLNKANAQTYLAAENTVKYAKPEEYKIRNVKIQKYFDKKYKNNFNSLDKDLFFENLSCLDLIALSVDEALAHLSISNT